MSALMALALLLFLVCHLPQPSSAVGLKRSSSALQPAPRLRLHNLFSGNMTLARSPQRAVMWGTAAPGDTVSIFVDGAKSSQAVADSSGNWTATLTAHPASVSVMVEVNDGHTSLRLENVAFGDVFFCSGQSNMQMPLDYSFGSAAEIAGSSAFPNVRLFSVSGNQYSATPLYESRLSYANGWVLPSPKTLQYAPGDVFNYFSGVCWSAWPPALSPPNPPQMPPNHLPLHSRLFFCPCVRPAHQVLRQGLVPEAERGEERQ